MRVVRQRRLGILSVTLLATAVGAVGGFWFGRAMLLRNAKLVLSEYARDLTLRADELSGELNAIFRQMNASPFPYCSDKELAELQALTFHSREMKDVGRTHDGKVDCSAFLGRIPHPFIEGPPTMVLGDGTHVYTNVAVMVASSRGDRGTVLELGGVDVVLGPSAFDHWNRPRISYMIVAVNHTTKQMAPIAGSPLQIDYAEVVSPESKIVSGIVYSSRCTQSGSLCAVTAERVADSWGWSRATLSAYSVMGGLAGLSVGLGLALLYLRTTSASHRLYRDLRTNAASLRMVYEPILDIESRVCVGAEALIRWTDEDGAPVPPDIFVPMAERNGFIGDLTAFVVQRSTSELGGLLCAHPSLTLSINIAAADMQGERLFALLDKHVQQAGISPGQIVLELTERSTADLAMVCSAIGRLRERGYKVHIDDFGTGFSSLSYLDRLDVDAIKIDRSFTRTIGTDAVTAPVLPQILAIAESLGLGVVVEGVETEMQKEYLESTSRPMKMQGWHFGRPMAAQRWSISKNKAMRSPPLSPPLCPTPPKTKNPPGPRAGRLPKRWLPPPHDPADFCCGVSLVFLCSS